MIFLNYEFVGLCIILYILYYATPVMKLRKMYLIFVGFGFIGFYGGLTSLVVISLMLIITFIVSRMKYNFAMTIGVITCIGVLIYFKYSNFIIRNILTLTFPSAVLSQNPVILAIAPTVIPLGISFFTFEFTHYLVDVRKGRPPITSFVDFLCFSLFWPTMVAGPIKRYEQFIPALDAAWTLPVLDNLAGGLGRIASGLTKKWAADNLTGWITYFEPQFSSADIWMRWLFVAALSARILLDFSGYSDMAIGFARMFGIVVPENFNWPYLARSPAEFWRRWHMSLSSWIRDYIYIPLGGSRSGMVRQVGNGLAAMALCGLWHGASWNFAAWGVYHGVGLASTSLAAAGHRRLWSNTRPVDEPGLPRVATTALGMLSWAGTLVFVGIGWLLFFYPLDRAMAMAGQLFGR
jgi:alginate O-acetyltransferase complex protein AlgI